MNTTSTGSRSAANAVLPKIAGTAVLAVAAVSVLSVLSTLTACAPKAAIRPRANFLLEGSYRSRNEPGEKPLPAMSLVLNGNGRFSLATIEGGCFVAEDRGEWKSSQEELSLRVRETLRRPSCAGAWEAIPRDTAFACPMRAVTDRSFRMLHEAIAQGTVWSAWEREPSQGYAELERMRMEPDREAVTLNTEPE